MTQKLGSFEVDIDVKGDKKTLTRVQKLRQKFKKSFTDIKKGVKSNLGKAGKSFEGFGDILDKGKGKLNDFASQVPILGDVISKIPAGAALAIGAIVAIGVAAKKAGEAIFEFAKEQSELLDGIDKASQKMGTTAEGFQRLEFSAKRSGAEVGVVGDGLKDLSIFIADIDKNIGDPKFIAAINEMGISFEDLKKANPEERLGMIADGLIKIEDPADRVTASLRVLGGAGKELQPLLAGGSEGLKAMGDEAESFGIASDEAVARGAALQDQFANFDQVITGIKAEIFEELSPAIEDIIEDVRGWIEQNKEFLTQDFAAALGSIARGLIAVIKWTVDVAESWKGFIKTIKDFGTLIDSKIQGVLDGIRNILGDIKERFSGIGGAVDGVSGVFAKFGNMVDKIKQKIIDFISKFDALKTLAIQLGVIDVKTTNVRGAPKLSTGQSVKEKRGDIELSEETEQVGPVVPPSIVASKKKKAKKQTDARIKELKKKAKKKNITQKETNELALLGVPQAEIDDLIKAPAGGKGKKKSDVTLSQGLVALRTGGKDAEKLISNFNSLAKKAPDTKGVEPTVAITNNIFDIKFNINNPKLAMDVTTLEKTVETAFEKIQKKANAKTAVDISSARRV